MVNINTPTPGKEIDTLPAYAGRDVPRVLQETEPFG